MNVWTYYSPLLLGLAFGVMIAINNAPDPVHSGYVAVAAGWVLVLGLACQAAFTGMQGVSAQVLPVPIGRSIRGRGASVTGALLLLTVALAAAGAVLHFQKYHFGATVVFIAGAAAGLATGISYFWCLATAVADFRARE